MSPSHDLLVIMGATESHGTMPIYLNQLRFADIPYSIENISDRPNLNGGGNLQFRVDIFRHFANKYAEYEKLIISDAFDVTFYGAKSDVIRKIPTDRLLHAAEKNCYPPASLALSIINPSPWRYANGGLVAGTPEQFLKWCSAAETHALYSPHSLDQHFLNIQTSEGMILDTQTELFYCLFGGYDELQFEQGIPINTMYNTHPQFLHANGKWTADEMFDRYQRSLNV